jgi:hypothetical protein
LAQAFLDPDTAKTQSPIEQWAPNSPLPPALQKFGYFLDLRKLLPGDLILFSAQKPNFVQRRIRAVQTIGGFGPDHARWEHAAVYIGSGAVCEATGSGVGVGDLFTRIETSKIRVRRNPNLSNDERWMLVVHALKQKNYAYGMWSIATLIVGSRFGYWKHKSGPISFPHRTYICSQLYGDSHVAASGTVLCLNQTGIATPAGLSMDTTLQDITAQPLPTGSRAGERSPGFLRPRRARKV